MTDLIALEKQPENFISDIAQLKQRIEILERSILTPILTTSERGFINLVGNIPLATLTGMGSTIPQGQNTVFNLFSQMPLLPTEAIAVFGLISAPNIAGSYQMIINTVNPPLNVAILNDGSSRNESQESAFLLPLSPIGEYSAIRVGGTSTDPTIRIFAWV